VLINHLQAVLAEKRTSLSVLRTGIVLLTLPMSIVTFLITMSGFYDPMHNLMFLIPLFMLNTVLVVMGFILISRAWMRVVRQDRRVEALKRQAAAEGFTIP